MRRGCRCWGSRWLFYLVDDVGNAFSVEDFVFAAIGEDAADFFHGFEGPDICLADDEDDGVDELEGVGEHEAFHFAVVVSAPVGTGEEGPADLDFAFGRVEVGVAGGADDFLGFAVDDDEGAAGREGVVEELFEDVFFVAVGDGVLFPDQRIGGGVEEFLPIVGPEGPEFEEIADEVRLELEGFQRNLHFDGMNELYLSTGRRCDSFRLCGWNV